MNNLKLKKMIAVVIMASMTLSMTNAVSAEYYITDADTGEKGNVTYAPGVTPEMTKTSYWSARTYTDADKVMMTAEEINEVNKKALNTKATNMYDLEDLDGEYNADALSNSLTKESIPSDDVYIDGKMVDKDAYFGGLKDAISNTGFTGTRDVSYAICVKGADIKSWPEYKFVGYDVADTDDEFVLSSLTVNEPFVVKQKAVVNGHTFYWGFSNIVTGWVDGDNIAFCSDKEEWIRNWKVTNGNKDFIVVTQDKIVLEPSIYAAYSSEVKLKFGTVLKLVKKEDMPRNIAERATWNNYVVYLPTRNDEGMLETKMALISEHCNVSVGFLPMTQRNIIDVSLQCLGNRYGWGGMLDSMDCSLFTRNVYKCFGFELPRNTNWQKYIPGTCTNLSGMNVDEKQAYLETMPAGTLLYMRSHTMIYLGSEEHTGYVISDLGTVADSDVGSGIFSVQSVAITPLTVQRKDFTTWLSNLTDAVVFKIPVPEEETVTTDSEETETQTETVTGETETASGEVTTSSENTTKESTTSSEDATKEMTTNEVITTAPAEKTLPGTKIKKITAKKRVLKVTWKKVKGVTGYKLQYADNRKFKKAKTITVKKLKKSKTIKGLLEKKTYYVRIRTYLIKKSKYKEIIYYSDWSEISKKKIK